MKIKPVHFLRRFSMSLADNALLGDPSPDWLDNWMRFKASVFLADSIKQHPELFTLTINPISSDMTLGNKTMTVEFYALTPEQYGEWQQLNLNAARMLSFLLSVTACKEDLGETEREEIRQLINDLNDTNANR